MISPLRKAALAVTFLLIATMAWSQTTNNTTPPTVDTGPRTLSVPLRVVDLTKVSAVEEFYARYQPDLKQIGYDSFAGPVQASLPRGRTPDPYVLAPNDQVMVLLWGDPVDLGELPAQIVLRVAEDGTLFYAPVGQLKAEGLLRTEVEKSLQAGLAKKYKRFDLRLQVAPQRIFPLVVSGLVAQPGTVLVDTWTSLPEVLAQAGGVLENGTLRALKLVKADGREVRIDLYDLLFRAKKAPVKIEEGDLLWVGPIGQTVAVHGQVKVPGIFEILPGETVNDVLAFAGGPLVSANGAPLTKVTWSGESWVQSSVAWRFGTAGSPAVQDGDVYSLRSTPSLTTSAAEPGFVQVGGEVAKPGFIPWTAGMTLAQALSAAGGVLAGSYPSGLTLARESVIAAQKKQIDQAILSNNAQLSLTQTKLAKATDPVFVATLNQELTARTEAGLLLAGLLKSDLLGRVQIDDPTGEKTPLLPGDSIVVPRQDGVVLLFGEVYNPGAQIWKTGMTVRSALDAVGGVSPNGNRDGVYVVRSNGKVDSVTARGNFLGMSSLWGEALRPGDMVYVPTKSSDPSQSWALTKDVLSMVTQSTTTVTNVVVLLKTLGLF